MAIFVNFFIKSRFTFFYLMVMALLTLTLSYFLFDSSTLHFRPSYLNDQIGFIPVARHLVDYGHFIIEGQFQGIGSVIMPGLLNIHNTRLYMPGYYLTLALSFWALGVNPFSAILPNILAYLGTSALIYFLAKRLYGNHVAIISCFLFIFFPFNILFALSAMSEMNVVFFSVLAFFILTLIPEKYRLYFVPLLIALPYLFRQTGLYLIIPMLAFLYDQKNTIKIWQMVMITLASFACLHLINIWQGHQGLYGINFLKMLTQGEGVDYSDAFRPSNPNNQPIALLVIHHFFKNILQFLHQCRAIFEKNQLILIISLLELFSFIVASVWIGLSSIKKNLWFPLSCALLTLAMLGSCFVLYLGAHITLLRISLFTVPFLMIQTARQMCLSWESYKTKLLSFYLVITIVATTASALDLRSLDKISHEDNLFLESTRPLPNLVLAAPVSIFTEYAYKHYPQLVSFVPANKQTLNLLNEQFPIGTIIIEKKGNKFLGTKLTMEDLQSIGLFYADHVSYSGKHYIIFKTHKNNRAKNLI